MDCSDELSDSIFTKDFSRKSRRKSKRTSGLVPTTLAEPSDSILSSPKQLSTEQFGTDSIASEFLFPDEIEDEISNEIFEPSEVMNAYTHYSDVDSDTMSKRSNLSEVGSSKSSKRPNSQSRDGSSRSRSGGSCPSKRARKGSDDPLVVRIKEEKTKCTKCKEFFDPSEFRRHNRNEHDFGCDQLDCDYFLESDLALLNHKKKVHMIEPNNSYSSNWQQVCEACGKSIPSKKWEVHRNTFHPNRCEETESSTSTACTMRFLTVADLNTHVKKAHKSGKSNPSKRSPAIQPVVPNIINETPRKDLAKISPQNLTPACKPIHVRPSSPMPGEEYWVCHKCGDHFPTEITFRNHDSKLAKTHIVPCEEPGCDKVMTSKAVLYKHMWEWHDRLEKVKQCERCQDVVDIKSWAAHEKKPHDSLCGYDQCGASIPLNKLLWQHMIKRHGYGKLMNPSGEVTEGELYESEDDDLLGFEYSQPDLETSLELDVDEIENEVIRDEGAKSKNSVDSYEEVEQVVEADEGQFIKCKVCEMLIIRSKIRAHSNKIHKFKCIDGCALLFTQEHFMYSHCFVEHNNTKHIAEKGYLVCPECSEFFEDHLKRSYDLHVKTGIHLTCGKCEMKFGKSKYDEFKFHCDFAHKVATDIACGICDLVFTTSDSKLLERHRKKPHTVGPCPHCKEISSNNLMFETKERFVTHHEQDHGTLAMLDGCNCMENIRKDIANPYDMKDEIDMKGEDAYDLSEQITDESSIDEELQFDYKNFKTDVTGALKSSDPTNDCLEVYFDTVKDEIEEDFQVKEMPSFQSVEVEILSSTVVGERNFSFSQKTESNEKPNEGDDHQQLSIDGVKVESVLEHKVEEDYGNESKESDGGHVKDNSLLNIKVGKAENHANESLEIAEVIEGVANEYIECVDDEIKDTSVVNLPGNEVVAEDEQLINSPGEVNGRDMEENIVEVLELRNDSPDTTGNIGISFEDQEDILMDIQDNSISTTDNISIPEDTEVPVEELIDSDPEVSSSYFSAELDRQEEDSKDSDISNSVTSVESLENLIGISQQGVLEKSDEEVEVENSVATVNIAPDVIIDDNDLPVNLVPYVDTDSDCDSVEDHEKRVAASRLAAESISNDAPAVISALDMDAFKVEGQGVTNKVDHGELMASKKSSQPNSLLKKVTGQKVSKEINFKTVTRTERSVSSDAQIVCLEESEEIEQPDEIEVDEFIKQIEAKDNSMDIEKIEIKTVAMEASVSVTPAAGICDYLAAEVSPSQEEVNRAMERVKRNSGEECSGIRFSLLGKLGKSPSKLLGSPRGNSKDELVNFSPHSQRKEDEYAFPVDFGKSDPEVGSYQSLVRPGKPGRKKPCKSAFSHETEETQMQADIARQEQEKRINRTRQGVVGKTAAGSSFIQPGCSVLRTVQPTSVIRSVPRQTPAAQQPGHTGASAQLLRHIIPQPQDQIQFITIPSTTPHQLHQSSKRPPTVQNMQSFDAKAAASDQAESDVQASPAEPDIWLSRHKNEPHRTYSRPRRSTEAIDHSYVMDMDEDDFDLSEKLDEMEKDFDTSESPENMVQEESHDNMVKEQFHENIIPEESLENIKDLLDSQVASQESSSTPNNSQSTISLSSGDDLGLYSPGDDHIPEPSVMDDPIQHNSSVISIRTDFSAEEISDILLPVKPFDKTNQDKEVKVSPNKKSQDETYDDVDDLLGDSDDDDDDIVEKREPVPVPMIKVALPSEPVPVPMIKVALPSEPSRKKPPKFVCPECNQKYGKNEAQYNNHIRQKHNFPCKYCPLRFTYVNGLEEHLNSVHINETAKANSTSFCCNICNKSFTRQGPYLKHKKRDHNIPCIECDMVFTNEPFLEEHMASMHGINSPPTGKAIKMRKPTSPVEVKFQLANGMINDSPKKIKPREEALNEGIGSKKDPIKKASFKMEASKKSKASKSIFKSIKDISVLSEDDTICEKCGQKFVELEAFEHHIELPHEHQCGMKNCELSFVFQYYLDLHIYLEHKTGIKPDERDKPIEESVHVAASSHNNVSMEDQISLADLAVSEDYLPGIGPQSLMCGVDAAKLKSLKNYKIPKKSASPVELDKSIERSLNSSWSNHDGSPVNVNNHFSTDKSFDQHSATHYNGGKTYLGSPSGSSFNNLKCHECNLTFGDRQGLDDHVSSHYNPSTSRQASGNKKLKCPLCNQYFEEMVKMMDHLRAKHGSGKIEKKHDFWCGLCRKGFETEKKFEDHEKLDHKYGCKHCHKAYILEVDLNHHVEKSHKVQTKYKEGFTCQLCGVNVSEMETFKIHQSQGHNVPCYLDGCDRRFQHKKELLSHLKTQHNVVQIRIGDDSEEEHRGYLTTERSQANIDIAEWAESWIDSPLAVEHMKKVMKGVVKSRRHDLFLDKRERDQCSGSETSRLYQLSNPGFLGGGGEKDTVVIKHLIDKVFMEYFHEADTKLMELGNGTAFVYTSCVLFPETFIHQHQVQGKSREEAEQAFMEVAVDVEERKGLNQEIKEAAVQNRRDNDEDSGDEWVDHSDMEDDLDE